MPPGELQTVPSLPRLFDLGGRVALVTGGSRGLGLQIAEALGEAGARVLITSRRAADLESAVSHLRGLGICAGSFACDIGRPADLDGLLERIGSEGRLDILVNNAGATWGAPMEDHPLDGWKKVVDLNLTGTFMLTQAVGRRWMIPQGSGRILNMASIEGLRGHHHSMTGTIAYNTTKGGLVNFTRALAAEWGRFGIGVNALAPGYFHSKMTAGTLERHERDLLAQTPLGRLGGSEDLKGAALLLVCDAGRHISGQILAVDGGATAL